MPSKGREKMVALVMKDDWLWRNTKSCGLMGEGEEWRQGVLAR